jgi:hypothetical protein
MWKMTKGMYDTVKFEKKTALTNDILNIVRSEILMPVNTATGIHTSIIRQAALMFTHTHIHPCGLFYANACNEIIYFNAALWQCYGFKSSGM